MGDVGTQFQVSAGEDLSAFASVTLEVQKPDGSVVTWTGAVDGADPTVYVYTAAAGDLDQPGKYKLQLVIQDGGNVWRGDTAEFKVYEDFR